MIPKPSPAMIVALVGVVIGLGGVAFATIPDTLRYESVWWSGVIPHSPLMHSVPLHQMGHDSVVF